MTGCDMLRIMADLLEMQAVLQAQQRKESTPPMWRLGFSDVADLFQSMETLRGGDPVHMLDASPPCVNHATPRGKQVLIVGGTSHLFDYSRTDLWQDIARLHDEERHLFNRSVDFQLRSYEVPRYDHFDSNRVEPDTKRRFSRAEYLPKENYTGQHQKQNTFQPRNKRKQRAQKAARKKNRK
jgi:hypothetical protein